MADLPYRIVIGLEVHVQLLTKTKLFCGCSTQFGLPPNSATCPVCIGMPGVLPVMNRRAFELGLKAALALNCQISGYTKWDRKNYYYPDLPKNFQISQYDLPFSHDGWIEIDTPAGSKTPTGTKKVGIVRAHLEEDAGKMLHGEKEGESLVDLNRVGTPLLEIVSQPDIASPEEAKAYLDELKLLLLELGISDCEMQEGSLRCDANVNIHVALKDRSFAATPIVEVKNMNSFNGVQAAMAYEARRQYEEFQKNVGKTWELLPGKERSVGHYPKAVIQAVGERRNGQLKAIAKETHGWNAVKGVTTLQRRKEEASDYRYFPEPDLVPVVVDKPTLDAVKESLGELPAARRKRLQQQYALSPYDARVLTDRGRAFSTYFEKVAEACGNAKAASNWVTNDVAAVLNERRIEIEQFPISPIELGTLIKQQQSKGFAVQRAREAYLKMLDTGSTAAQTIKDLGLEDAVSDEGQIVEIVRKAIAGNAKAVADFKNGKVKAADAIKGAIMRETKGKANVETVQRILMEELAKA